MKRALLTVVACLFVTTAWSADRVWQIGTWRDAQVQRPKVVFGIAPRDPNSGVPRSSPPPSQEIRTFVIETDTLRLELKQNATVDTPRIDAMVGEPVSFALEKNTVYVKDLGGREHRMSVTKKSAIAKTVPR
jgi:hypothetical protein